MGREFLLKQPNSPHHHGKPGAGVLSPWAKQEGSSESHLPSLSLSFLIYKMGLVLVYSPQHWLEVTLYVCAHWDQGGLLTIGHMHPTSEPQRASNDDLIWTMPPMELGDPSWKHVTRAEGRTCSTLPGTQTTCPWCLASFICLFFLMK